MKTGTSPLILVAFALGCAAARAFVVPPAQAQSVQRWEYFCFVESGAEDVSAIANEAGAQGWEMTTVGPNAEWCFKRAK